MDDLISRKAAIKSLRESEAYDEDIPNRADGVRDAIIDIMSLPTVDAVPVVRCNDCEHYKKSEASDRMMCWRNDVDGWPVCYDFNPNDFCSYGGKRNEG